ncbi:HPF/RaiA family ribosome-associated protein [Thiohalobacter sp. IOR34]|uniref:HPF/RaiA family ribosome-associated protein n=1 Tax=Thiohalobacter sp. IOR34 TaxID=3057176 RepID=UPI0025B15A2B|nr:HPF/RaiA family ribosome-associated protein [Thiohalobacter sp. IOR34]WJW76419.1 HPF/RaiA family ribosome-associated protein [Thiohalobacter sp. IOR34]
MQLPLQITFRHMPPSEALEADIRKHAAKLDQVCENIMSCRVVVGPQHKHHRQGNLYQVKIDLTVPGTELAVSQDPGKNHAHEDAYVAVRDAFDSMRRELEDYVRRRKGKVKHHEPPPEGRISQLHPEQDYGMIETPDGREIYFHRNSVIDADFDRLEIGMRVIFCEEAGEQGPQASTVHVKGA